MSTIIGYTKVFDGYKQRVAISSKTKKSGEPLHIPICLDNHNQGNQLLWTHVKKDDFDLEYTFDEELKFLNISKGRSAIHFFFQGLNGKYCMFIKDFEEIFRSNKIDKGKIIGRFKFSKRGQNFGIVYLGEN